MNNDIDIKNMANDFVEIDNEDESKKYIIIIVILYIVVIVLTILLIFCLKNQKDTIVDRSENNQIETSNLIR